MIVEVDYYEMLGVARDADAESVENAIKKAMREWRKRTEAADLSVRQEAEVKVKQIDDARKALLDEKRRREYDAELAKGVPEVSRSTPQPSGAGGSWLERAEGYLAIGDYHSAAYAAREATRDESQNAKTWWLRSRANAGLGLWQDALYEARQATNMDESKADYHFNLGLIHEQMSSHNEAIDSYRRAGTCEPGNPMYELAVGGVYATTGRLKEALPIFESVYKKHPNDDTANYYLGTLLIDMAEQVPSTRNKDSYVVESALEIIEMRKFAERAKNLNIVEPEIRQAADHILSYLADMERKVFRPPWALIMSGAAMGSDAGCFGAMLGGSITIGIFLLPVILLMTGLGQMGGDNPGGGFFVALIGAGLCWVWWKLMYVPNWKHNKRGL